MNAIQLTKTGLFNTAFAAEAAKFSEINGCTTAQITARTAPDPLYGKCLTANDVANGLVEKIKAASTLENSTATLVTDYKYTSTSGVFKTVAKSMA